MAIKKVPYTKLGLSIPDFAPVKINIKNQEVEIIQYLPIAEKGNLIQWIMNNAIDDATGTFSPLRIEVYFSLAIAKWYANITFTDKQMEKPDKLYDTFESNDLFAAIIEAIPEGEYQMLVNLVDETIADASTYNHSAAGIINAMANSSNGLNNQITEMFEKIRNKEGLELLDEIKHINGQA